MSRRAAVPQAIPEGMQVYRPDGETLRRFILDDAEFSNIQGPWGSGKSVACCMKLWRYATQQVPGKDGIRRTRWVVVRNTFQMLQDTTLKTWLEWFPEALYGPIVRTRPFRHHIRVGDVDCEVIFLALDDEEDRKKLLSFELTGAWVNEMRELPKGIIDDLTGRVGRYPAMRHGGPSWRGVLSDTNAPSEDHWLPVMRGDVPPPDWMTEDQRTELRQPEGWRFYVQPPGMVEELDEKGNVAGYVPNPEAENQRFQDPGYYPRIIKGKSKSWIDVNVLNRLGSLSDGKPVWPMYRAETHLARRAIEPVPGVKIIIGVDFGRQPAAVYCQEVRGRWLILAELIGRDMGATTFAPLLKRDMAQRFPGWKFELWGDPSGDYGGQTDERTPFMIFKSHGLAIRPAQSNDLDIRLQVVEAVLNRMVDGQPAFLLDPGCVTLKSAMQGGYCFRRLKVSGGERYSPEPEKNAYSHGADALQYAFLGGGEGRLLTIGGERAKPVDTRVRQPVFGARAAAGGGGRLRGW